MNFTHGSRVIVLALVIALLVAACGDDGGPVMPVDSGSTPDAGTMALDAGTTPDAGAMNDAGATDAGPGAANDTCADAPTITPGTLMGSTVGANNDYGDGALCAGTAGLDVVYQILVPAGQTLTATVTPVGATYNPSISLVNGEECGADPRICEAGQDTGGAMEPDTASWLNMLGPNTIYIVIDSAAAADTGGMFTLTTALM